ncbi:magnesium chelatase domain-containing protein [Rossellomorea oryzaecorticis]|uniref:Magnesium chelatase domain-containing protein n=1 Tax=Rossellomorea oryzaecorticis TaxID=1396505 RepID=A0ABW8VXG7_9BACI
MESIVVVGLPDASVKESKERVSAALRSLGFSLVDMKVIINLSPAEQKKNGPLFDMAIAIGVLKSTDFLKGEVPDYCRQNEPLVHTFEPPNAEEKATKCGVWSHLCYINKYLSV